MAAKKKEPQGQTGPKGAPGIPGNSRWPYEILRPFTDVHTGAEYVPGDVVEFLESRAEEIRASVGEGWITKAQ